MKTLSIILLGLTLSSAYAITPTSNLQTTVTVQRSDVALAGPQKKQAREEVAFNFENTHALLENSRNSKTPITLTLPLGNNETTEITVQSKTSHIGQIIWKDGQFVPVEHPYLSFEGTTQDGGRVRGFISEQSFSAIVHSAKNGHVLVQSKSLQAEETSFPTTLDTGFEESDTLPPSNALFSPLQPAQFQSPVDAGGHVLLRHIGLLFTITQNTFDAVIANYQTQNPGQPFDPNIVLNDWVTNFAFQVNDVFISQLGVTIDPIGITPELDGVRYIVQPTNGYPSQPADSIFSQVPLTTRDWGTANHKFQSWVVQNGGANPAWWDLGFVLGAYDLQNPSALDPAGSVAQIHGLCTLQEKGNGYVGGNINGFGSRRHVRAIIHETGHMMNAEHTYSSLQGECGAPGQFSLFNAVEPGSGTTLMAYPGYCAPDNIVPKSNTNVDLYYHGKSIESINNYLTQLEQTNSCISHTPTQNRLPVLAVSNQSNANIIPLGVRFELKANLTDLDLDDQMAQDPNSVSLDTKLNGAGYVNWEQIDPLGMVPGPLYRSFPPQTANYPADFQPFDYRKGYVRSFPNEATPLGTQWDPLITTPGTLNFRATAWDTNANADAGFPGVVSVDVPVGVWDWQKPVFIFPAATQTIKPSVPPNNITYTVTWLPNFASSQTKFTSITLAYKHPLLGWKELTSQQNAAGTLNSFSNVQFPPFLQFPGLPGSSYTTALRLEYKTLGDVTWFVESPTFQVQDEIVFRTGFEGN